MAPGILDGSGVGLAMASTSGATGAWINLVVVMLLPQPEPGLDPPPRPADLGPPVPLPEPAARHRRGARLRQPVHPGHGRQHLGTGTLVTGLVFAGLVIPVFLYRHHVVDGGRFPAAAVTAHQGEAVAPGAGPGGVVARAGMLPYLALAGGVVTVVVGRLLARY